MENSMVNETTSTPDDKLRTFYLAQRDKHLDQFMAINARSVFVILTLVVSILVGFDKIHALAVCPTTVDYVAAVIFCAGIVLLTLSGVCISLFHTARIRALETKSWSLATLSKQDFKIIPDVDWKNPFRVTLIGVILVVLAILMLLYHNLFG
jgi:hypothetical protein